MRKQFLAILTAFVMLASVGFVAAGPVSTVPLIGGGGDPIYTESDFVPLVFLNEDGGRILDNGLYFSMPSSGDGDIEVRTNNYAFTGESITWEVLVWDKNGVPEKIHDVYAGWAEQTNGPVPPEAQVNCQYIGPASSDSLESQGYPNVRRPGDQEAQVNGNPDTMGIYSCQLTIEPTCYGQKWLNVAAEDIDENVGLMNYPESWFCNPELDLTVSGNINFGELGPGEQGSSTFSVKNSGEAGSGVQVVLAVAGTDFYDPSSSGALCPTTNQLALQGEDTNTDFTYGFWYKAVMGSKTTVNPAVNPFGFKRIPYGTSIVDADPVFSKSNAAGSWKKWSASELVPMSPGSEATMTLYLGLPQPCNGQFTDGQINLYAWAI